MSAVADIKEYLNEWSGEFHTDTDEREGVELRVAQSVVAFHCLSFWDVPAYEMVVLRMVKRGDLKITQDDSGQCIVSTN